ncbi:MAG TPA: OsmC family protein [Vicinamibacterales bacterium]|nr:OsmC family protein [Vicinamibacterales bacterium]
MMTLSLDWLGELHFKNSEGSPAIDLHSSSPGVASPPQALAYATMACMGMDVVHTIQRGRHNLRAMSIKFEGERAAEHPRRFISMRMHFDITGVVADHVVERAIELSRTKYCSVWNTLKEDVALTTTFEVKGPST